MAANFGLHRVPILQVLKAAQALIAAPPASEVEVKPLEQLMAEAYCEIDKAVTRDVLHRNNAARKKARMARWKKVVLMSAGLWVPPVDHPDHARYQRMVAKKAVPAAAQ
jgi:ribosomal protein S20